MKLYTRIRHTANNRRTAAFGVLLGIVLLLTVTAGAGILQAVDDPGPGTIPPLARFIGRALPDMVQQGELVTYEVTIVNNDINYVNVVLGITGTLPAGVVAVPDSLQANVGQGGVTPDGQIVWEGRIEDAGTVLISYRARTVANTCGEKSSNIVLYEVENVGKGYPTSQQLRTTAKFTVTGTCPLYLPDVAKLLPSPIPSLQNWDFEQGADAPGWGQFDDNQPSTLIYSTDKKLLPMPHGGKWFGWLAGMLNKQSELRQKITLPANHSGIALQFLYMIESADDCGADKDNGYVLIDGAQIGSTFELCKPKAVNGWQAALIPIPSTHRGKEVELVLRSRTNAAKNSNWFVDNVRFCSTDSQANQENKCQ